jgi:phosphoribosylaminoimidazole carboxylase PurE protein
MAKKIEIAIVMGSASDEAAVAKAYEVLKSFSVEYKSFIMSAHRTPKKVAAFATSAQANGYKVIIAAAGLAAALPGVIAAHTTLPVIGVPIAAGPLCGKDALFSIVQMPPGIPVATVGIGNAKNAAYLALSILALSNKRIDSELKKQRKEYGDA